MISVRLPSWMVVRTILLVIFVKRRPALEIPSLSGLLYAREHCVGIASGKSVPLDILVH